MRTMTGKENFKRAIEFKGPTYLPLIAGVNIDWLQDKDEGKRSTIMPDRINEETIFSSEQ